MSASAVETKRGLDDAFADGFTREALEACIVESLPDSRPSWAPTLPLDEPAGPPFPVGALPGLLGEYVVAVADSTQTPPDLPALMALGTLSAAARGRYAVRIPDHDWHEPAVLQAVAFLHSGERKSAVVAEVTGPVVTWERERHLEDATEIQEWASRHRVLKKQLDAAEHAASMRRGPGATWPDLRDLDLQRQAAARELADHEKLMKHPTRVVAHDVTPEMAKQMIVEQGGAMAIIEAEGTYFSNIAGRYTDGKKAPPIEVMLTGHAGEPVTVDRKTGPAFYTPRGHLTIAVACQPKVAEAMGGVDGFRVRGGAARILPAFPSSRVGYRSTTAPAIPEPLRAAWRESIRAILNHSPVRPADSAGYPQYCELYLSAEAYAAFQAYRRWHEPQLRRGGTMGDFADWGNKLPGAVLRIAGLVHLATHQTPEHGRITADTIRRAVTLAAYFTDHARIMYRVMAGRSGMHEAGQVWEVVQALPVPTTKRDIHRKLQDRAAFQKAETLTEPLAILEEYGWLHLERQGKSIIVTRNPLSKETPDDTDNAPRNPADHRASSGLSVFPLERQTGTQDLAPTGTDGALAGEYEL